MTIGNGEELFMANFCFRFYVHQISLKSKLKIPLKNEKIILGLELQMRGVQINKKLHYMVTHLLSMYRSLHQLDTLFW